MVGGGGGGEEEGGEGGRHIRGLVVARGERGGEREGEWEGGGERRVRASALGGGG